MPRSNPMRSYLAARADFASGKQTPRQFLERSLELLGAMGAADRRLRLHQSAGGARGGGAIDRTLARRQAAVADRRHAGRHQGHYRDGRYADPDGLAAVCRLALGEGRRQRARAARRRRRDPRQDGDDRVRRVRAARHAQSVEYRAHAGRLVERLGGRRRRRHRQRGARHPGDRLDDPAGEFLRLLSASSRASTRSTAKAATIIRARAAPAFSAPRWQDVWQVAHEIVARVGGDAGTPGLQGPDTLPPAEKPRRLAVLETAGWDSASAGAKQQLNECVMRLKSAGIEIRTRHNDDKVAALETDLVHAAELSHRCNGWETRWFFRSMRDRDAAKLSRNVMERAQKYEDLTLAEHRADLKERARIRAVYAELAANCDACITLAAPSGAPEGLGFDRQSGIRRAGFAPWRAGAVAAAVRGRRHAARLAGDRLFRSRRRRLRHRIVAYVFVDAGAVNGRESEKRKAHAHYRRLQSFFSEALLRRAA